MKLYEIAEQYQSIQSLAESEDATMVLAVADTMEAIEGDFKDKAQAVVAASMNISADIAAIDAQIKRLQDKKKSIQSRVDWLRNYLKRNMDATGITKISCPLFSATLAAPGKKVEITDETKIPDKYVRVKTVVDPDIPAILMALKEGADIPGAMLVDSERRLIIK
jgi:hypothetical protein